MLIRFFIALSVVLAAASCGEARNTEHIGDSEAELKNGDIPAYGVMFGFPSPDARVTATGENNLRLLRVIFPFDGSWRWPEVPSLTALDEFVLQAANENIVALPILIKTVDTGGAGTLAPEEDELWKRFVRTLAVRYGPKGTSIDDQGKLVETGTLWRENPSARLNPIRAWEIWNEPNLTEYWTGSAADYRRVLLISKQALRRVNPSARIIFGGLSLPNAKKLDFFDAVVKDGGGCLFDALAIHPYAETATKVMHIIQLTREHLKQKGFGSRDLWITEIGWAVGNDSWPWQDASYTVEKESTRVARITALARLIEDERKSLRIGPLVWYTINDLTYDTDKWAAHSGFFPPPEAPQVARRSWHKVGKIASDPKHRLVSLPPVRLCAWERSATDPFERCGCQMKCEQNAVYLVDEAMCSQIASLYCGSSTAYTHEKCEGP